MNQVVHTEHDVGWLPVPNTAEIVYSEQLCPADLTKTSFVVPIFDNGDVLLAHNRRRGLEIPGGHVENGETLEEAARREAYEEAGCRLLDLYPIGFQRLCSTGVEPEDYRYPFPLAYQQFFAARIDGVDPSDDYECDDPVRVVGDDFPRPSIEHFVQRARELFEFR